MKSLKIFLRVICYYKINKNTVQKKRKNKVQLLRKIFYLLSLLFFKLSFFSTKTNFTFKNTNGFL